MTTDPQRIIELNAAAATYYRDELHHASADGPRNYLKERGFERLLTTEKWTVGYAPPGWTSLIGHLRREGSIDQELLDAGLALTSRRGTLIDRFRDRLMFGIRNPTGDLVGFTGRAAPSAGPDCPKYLNTPTTPVFVKSKVLFGLAENADALAAGAVPVITEGPLDAIAFDDTGAAGLATLGTALTHQQVQALVDRANRVRVITAFDADDAGTNASAAAYRVLATEFKSVDTLTLPEGKDAAHVLRREGSLELLRLIDLAEPLATTLIRRIAEQCAARTDSAEARVAALRQAAPLVVGQPEWVAARNAQLAAALGLDHDTVTRELVAAAERDPGPTPRFPQPVRRGSGLQFGS